MSILQLQGKVCLITGASKGIGFSSAKILALHGASVILVGRNKDLLESNVNAINNEINSCIAMSYPCDITSEHEVKVLFQWVFKTFKRLDVLVANAGILEDSLIGMTTKEQIERVFAVNTFGLIYCAQYACRLMSRNKFGSIINISSIIATNGNAGQTVYGGSKAAVLGITKSLAKELANQNIRVNAIAPGFIDTDMTRSIPLEKYEERLSSISMGRVGTPEDVAGVVLFLASNLSNYITGQTIGVDGGMLI
ncbi:3-oxoacyl-ACP reductase [Polynucleobacter sp. SHI8]|uniref:SDR family NAD(P)-dependent oxidoreductase n=1 Tax=unclassified Polynucleobacter TaxID=2640945 RepID=UPI0024935893|nr:MULTISPECIES: SDR family NAD(P)-dependent oxidoreductase [unclassified Polynucleobacter]BDW10197.1 3-oxoacyl-ACP reductase [Polynucleobacter sp. SHI2]BDW12643.1 3-oxoacyl-ACP reductase [Polynucleobacter sp. SHI8]